MEMKIKMIKLFLKGLIEFQKVYLIMEMKMKMKIKKNKKN